MNPESKLRSESRTMTQSLPDLGPVNILIVDDHPHNLLALEALLRDPGYTLIRAASGREALKHLMDDEFAVILLDVKMPDMDGFETAELIRQREQSRHIPIIFLTAIDMTASDVTRGYSVGAIDYLFKPVNPEILRLKVRAFADLHLKGRELKERGERLRRREQEEHERQLLEVRTQRDRFFSLPHDMMGMLDPEGVFREVNPAWGIQLGFSPHELQGFPLAGLFHPEDRAQFHTHWTSLQEGRGVVTFEARTVTKSGNLRWLAWTLMAFPNERIYYAVARDITERIRSELELNDFFENSPVGFSWVGADGIILRANRAELAMLGYSRDEYVGRSIKEIHADPPVIEDILERLGRGETLVGYRARLKCRNGAIKEVLIDSNVLWQDGRFVHTRCFTRDVTDQKESERWQSCQHGVTRVLAESASFAEAVPRILKAVSDCLGWETGALWLLDPAAAVLRCRHLWQRPGAKVEAFAAASQDLTLARGQGLVGRVWAEARAAWLSEPLLEELPPPRREAAKRDGIRTMFASPIILGSEVLGVLEFTSREARPSAESVVGMMAALGSQIGQFIERKRAEDALAERTMRIIRQQAALLELSRMDPSDLDGALKRITEISSGTLKCERVSVWMFDDELAAVTCRDLYLRQEDRHEQGVRLEGSRYPKYFAALQAQRIVAADDAETDPRTSEFKESYLNPLGIVSMMDVAIHHQGRMVGILCHEQVGAKRAWTLEEQEFAGSVADRVSLCLAVAERRRAADEIQRLNITLEARVQERTAQYLEALQEQEQFAYSVSHDLRAPLRAMHGFSQALLEEYSGELGESGRDYAKRIMEAAGRMDALIKDLLAYSRLSRSEFPMRSVDLGAILSQALKDTELERVERKGEVKIVEPLPQVRAHELTLLQVVTNLISNGLKFVAPGTAPRVVVRSEERQGRVRLWIEDNGIGIQPEHHERIFHIFERLNRVELYPGTGIGLAIVRKGAARMGGDSGVESDGRNGSRFWIELEKAERAP